MIKATALLFFSFILNLSFGQSSDSKPISLKFDNDYFIPANDNLTNALSNKNIIAIGEATHGSREFIEIRRAMFFYLFRNLGYKHMLLEIPQSIGLELNEYINGQRKFTYIDSILKPAKTIYSEEFFSFLDECKKYNLSNKANNKIYIGGFDIDQYFDITINRIRKSFLLFDKKNLYTIDSLTINIPNSHDLAFKNGKEYASKNVKNAIINLRHYVFSIKNEIPDTTFKTIELCLNQLDNSYHYYNINSRDKKRAFRDKIMSDNIQNMMKLLNFEKVFIWAHNNHIRNNDFGINRMGTYLKKDLGNKYLSIATVFEEGSYRVLYKVKLSVMNLPASTRGELADYFGTFNDDYLLFQSQYLPNTLSNKKIYIHDVGILQTVDNPKANKYRLIAKSDFDMYIYIKNIHNLALPE